MFKYLADKPAILFVVLFIAAFGFNLWQLKDGARDLLAVVPYSDAYLYHYSAWFKASISNQSYISGILAFSPYEILLLISFQVFGHSNTTPFILNVFLSSMTLLILANCTRTLFSLRAAILCAFAYLLCDPILFFAGTTLKTSLVVFLTSLSLWCAIKFYENYQHRWAILFCTFVFICAIERIHVLVLFAAFFPVLWSRKNSITKSAKIKLAATCAVCLITMFSASKIYYGAEPNYLSPIGLNIYLGHTKPDNWSLRVDGVRNHLVGHREDAKILAEQELGRPLSNSGVTKFWLLKTWGYIKENPIEYFKTQTQKLAFLFAPSSYSTQESYHHWRKKTFPLQLAFVNFATIFPLFIIGIVLLRKDKSKAPRGQTFTALAAFLYLASLMATIVIERYRVTAFVFMLPIASYALLELFKSTHRRPTLMVILVLIFAGSQLLGRFALPTMSSDRLSRLENQDIEQRRKQESWFDLREKLDRQPLSRDTCFEMQNALTEIGYHRDLKALAIACVKK